MSESQEAYTLQHDPAFKAYIRQDQFVIAQPWSNKEPTGESAFWIA
jgi:hypothetical protein